MPEHPLVETILSGSDSQSIFAGNASVSLVDLGDEVGCFALHSKKNTFNAELVFVLLKHLQPDSHACRTFKSFVIATSDEDFSFGMDLATLAGQAQQSKWDDLEISTQKLQEMTQAIKFCPRPVVVAPAGRCLGSGAEVALHGARCQPHVDLKIGLVETAVGLIPVGGGCKERLLLALADAERVRIDTRGESSEVVGTVQLAFGNLVMAKVSSSAAEARGMRLVGDRDVVTMNRSELLHDAKTLAVALADAGYSAPARRNDIRAPGTAVMATLRLGIYTLREGTFISAHDAKVGTRLAHVLTGGAVAPGTLLSEQYLLDLEREAFLSLCAEPKTIERITFTLENGKPLRN